MYLEHSAFYYFVILCCTLSLTNGETTIVNLFNTIKEAQILHDSNMSIFPPTWAMKKGMYPNEVKLNFHGNEQFYLVRDEFKVPDNNMFTPAWVTASLIEAYIYGTAPKPTADQISLALGAIDSFRNRNVPYKNSEMTFWQQKLNKTAKFYQSSPENLFEVLRFPDYLPQKLIEEILQVLGLKDLEDLLEKLFHSKDMFAQAFHIPPDFDDTFVNIGLGSLLTLYKEQFPDGFQMWTKQNDNLTSVFEKVKKYAYRPFSKESSAATIDPRTYMYLRTYLDRASANNEDVALVTTWVQDTVEVTAMFDKGVAMPFNVNNVDITVSANFVFGMVTCLLTGVCEEHIDADIQMLKFAFQVLRPVLRQQMSIDIRSAAKQDSDGSMYIDDFLGNNDLSFFNKTINRAEDRIFSTAVSVNALINTWTLTQDNTLIWEKETPDFVPGTVKKLVMWLDKNTLSGMYKPWNSFFSGSGKSLKSMPFFYPANRREYFNGTTFSDKKFPSSAKNIIGMQGYVSYTEYTAMLRQPHFGMMTPMTFDGYNSEAGGFFPLWSCDSYTYAVSMLALAQYDNIKNEI